MFIHMATSPRGVVSEGRAQPACAAGVRNGRAQRAGAAVAEGDGHRSRATLAGAANKKVYL